MDNEKEAFKRRNDDIYSNSLRAGNRTYFFDVKSTKSEDLYLTITESKRKFNNDNGKFFYEKHKLFLYPEDFSAFQENLQATLDKISELNGGKEIKTRTELDAERDTQEGDAEKTSEEEEKKTEEIKPAGGFSDVSFDDL